MNAPASLPVPVSRLSRLARLGSLASGIAAGMVGKSMRQLAGGQRPKLGDLLLTPANARRVADQLAHLRGAAMKVGQLLSMDAGDLLPPELREILARLRADARPMPMSQLVAVLDAEWGSGWDRHFERFSFTPMAAASIGQVHAARLKDGRQLAIKVQYPGVRESIASDVDNVATLLRISGLLPRGIDFSPLLEEAKQQLQDEADYRREGELLARYGQLLAGDGSFALPSLIDELSTRSVLSMSFVDGTPVEALADTPQDERDRIMNRAFGLFFRELFEFRLMQTDPNFANYRYHAASGRLGLLDFGATRSLPEALVGHYHQLLAAGMASNRPALEAAAQAIGYFSIDIAPRHRQQVIDIFILACEPLRCDGPFDFAGAGLALRMRDLGLSLGRDRDFWHSPPIDAIMLHRKAAGLYLLAARLQARVNIRQIFLSQTTATPLKQTKEEASCASSPT